PFRRPRARRRRRSPALGDAVASMNAERGRGAPVGRRYAPRPEMKRRAHREKTVLVTGFETFCGEPVHPSALIAQALDGRTILGRRVVGAVLPCVFGAARSALAGELSRVRPELVVCVGQAGGRPHIALERVAINVDDAPIPDNAGAAP